MTKPYEFSLLGLRALFFCSVLLAMTSLIVSGVGQLSHWELDQLHAAFWDIVLKSVGGAIALVGAVIAVSKYFGDREATRVALLASDRDRREAGEAESRRRADSAEQANQTAAEAAKAAIESARRPFLEKRQEVYLAILDATGAISNNDVGSIIRNGAERDFWRLYWSQVPVVTDDCVGRHIDSFSVLLSDEPNDSIGLRNASMNLARACRTSLGYAEY